jgi:hypothetical protein
MQWKNSRARFHIGSVLLAMISVIPSLQTQQESAAQTSAQHEQIIVQIRNGKTGRPIWYASPYVFLGSPDVKKFEQSYRRTKFWADARVDVTRAEPREARVWVDFIERDCRYAADFNDFRTFDFGGRTLRNMPFYDIDQILSTGIVTPNLCGQRTQQPKPGVLTIYVLPESLKELWDN